MQGFQIYERSDLIEWSDADETSECVKSAQPLNVGKVNLPHPSDTPLWTGAFYLPLHRLNEVYKNIKDSFRREPRPGARLAQAAIKAGLLRLAWRCERLGIPLTRLQLH